MFKTLSEYTRNSPVMRSGCLGLIFFSDRYGECPLLFDARLFAASGLSLLEICALFVVFTYARFFYAFVGISLKLQTVVLSLHGVALLAYKYFEHAGNSVGASNVPCLRRGEGGERMLRLG